MKKKIYIAGKVTGEDRTECTMKFGTAQKAIEALGFEVVNPLEVVGDWNTPWNVAMKKCISAMMICDAVVLLPDWQQSSGAIIENDLAGQLEIVKFNYTKFGLEVLKKNLWNN